MPFREHFDCLWCGRDWQVRGRDDLEGWAALCPDCLSKADDNGFLRARLRAGLRERAAAAAATPAHDDWYLRRGRFATDTITDGLWAMQLDEVTQWLDAQPLAGTIVELAAGTGWWSGLLAEKGELWLYDRDGAALDAARRRLVAHGLLAHLHERDPLSAADKQVDAVVAANFLGAAPTAADLAARIDIVRGWLRPGGVFAFIEVAPSVATTSGARATEGPAGPLWPRGTEHLRAALAERDLVVDEVHAVGSAFIVGRARRTS